MTYYSAAITIIETGVNGEDYLAHLKPTAHGWYASYGQYHQPWEDGTRMEGRFTGVGTWRRTYPAITKAARRKMRRWADNDQKAAIRLAAARGDIATAYPIWVTDDREEDR